MILLRNQKVKLLNQGSQRYNDSAGRIPAVFRWHEKDQLLQVWDAGKRAQVLNRSNLSLRLSSFTYLLCDCGQILISLGLSFLICNMGIISFSKSCWKD